MIKTKNLCIAYEKKVIIEDFSFSVEEGQMVSIIGPNGSGKSTCLKPYQDFLKRKVEWFILKKKIWN